MSDKKSPSMPVISIPSNEKVNEIGPNDSAVIFRADGTTECILPVQNDNEFARETTEVAAAVMLGMQSKTVVDALYSNLNMIMSARKSIKTEDLN